MYWGKSNFLNNRGIRLIKGMSWNDFDTITISKSESEI